MDRQAGRQTDLQTDTHTHKLTGTKTDTWTDKQADSWTDGQTDEQTDSCIVEKAVRLGQRQTLIGIDTDTGREKDKETERNEWKREIYYATIYVIEK
jgi:hypothetical protein